MHAAVFDLSNSHATQKASMSDVLKNSKLHSGPPNDSGSGGATLHKPYDERSAQQFEAIGSGRLTDGSPISVASAGSNPPTRRTRPLPPHARKRTASADDLLAAARANDLPSRSSSGGSKTPPLRPDPNGGLQTISPLQQPPSANGVGARQPDGHHSGGSGGRRTQSANDVLGPPRRSRFGPPKTSPPMLAALYAAAKKKEREKASASAGEGGGGGGGGGAGRGDLPLSLGDLVQWKGSDAEIPRGTTGFVSTIWNDGSGDVECVFGSKKFTFPAYRLQAIEREGPVTTTGAAAASGGVSGASADSSGGASTGAVVDSSGNEQKEARKAMRAAKREAQRRLVRDSMDFEEYLRKQARSSKEIEDLKKMRAQAKASGNNTTNAMTRSSRDSRNSRNSREHRSSRDVTSSSGTGGGGGLGGSSGARSRGTGTSLGSTHGHGYSKGSARRSGDRHSSPREDDNQRFDLLNLASVDAARTSTAMKRAERHAAKSAEDARAAAEKASSSSSASSGKGIFTKAAASTPAPVAPAEPAASKNSLLMAGQELIELKLAAKAAAGAKAKAAALPSSSSSSERQKPSGQSVPAAHPAAQETKKQQPTPPDHHKLSDADMRDLLGNNPSGRSSSAKKQEPTPPSAKSPRVGALFPPAHPPAAPAPISAKPAGTSKPPPATVPPKHAAPPKSVPPAPPGAKTAASSAASMLKQPAAKAAPPPPPPVPPAPAPTKGNATAGALAARTAPATAKAAAEPKGATLKPAPSNSKAPAAASAIVTPSSAAAAPSSTKSPPLPPQAQEDPKQALKSAQSMKSAKMRTAGAAAGKKGWGMFGGGGHHGAKEEAGEPLEDHSEIEVWAKMEQFVADLSKAKNNEAKVSHTIQSKGLRAFFKEMDKDGSGEVSLEELLARLKAGGFRMTSHDAAVLMAGLDADNSGSITYGEFTRALKAQAERVKAHEQTVKLGGVDADAVNAKIKHDAQARGKHAREARAAQLGWGDAKGEGAITGDDFYASKKVSPALKKVWEKIEKFVDARHREKDGAKLKDIFQEFDRSGDGVLAYDELDGALRAMGVQLDQSELLLLCSDLDEDGDGVIAYAEFANQVIAHHRSKVTTASGAKHSAIKELL